MEYIKKNKVFVSLLLVLIICIGALTFQVFNSGSNPASQSTDNSSNNTSSITSFNVTQTASLDMTFQWDIKRGSEKIEKMEIYHNGNLFQDVSDKAIYSLRLFESGIHTGNNEFTFKVTLGNGTILQKNTYCYIDEILDFSIETKKGKDGKVEFIATYYYDKDRVPAVPHLKTTFSQNINLTFEYKDTKKVREEGDYVFVQTIYEVDTSNVNDGSYDIALTYEFNDYNLEFKADQKLIIENTPEE